jgi:hypothetical protein
MIRIRFNAWFRVRLRARFRVRARFMAWVRVRVRAQVRVRFFSRVGDNSSRASTWAGVGLWSG